MLHGRSEMPQPRIRHPEQNHASAAMIASLALPHAETEIGLQIARALSEWPRVA